MVKRHPLAIETHFDFVFVLTYALPQSILTPLLPSGLTLDCHGEYGFVAVACVQTRNMRAKGLPRFLSQDYFLIGYRIFTRYKTIEGRNLRGLYILRSDTDRQLLVFGGNLFTHYKYHYSKVGHDRADGTLNLSVKSSDGRADMKIAASINEPAASNQHIADQQTAEQLSAEQLSAEQQSAEQQSAQQQSAEAMTESAHEEATGTLPPGSIFTSVRDALKFAGPLPFTFSYEKETGSIIRVEGVRQGWRPRAVLADVQQLTFLEQQPFNQTKPILCSSFYMEDISYYWKAGICEKVSDVKSISASEQQG